MAAEAPSLAARIETGIGRIASILSWVWLLLIGVIVFGVVLRFVFGLGRIELEETQWHLYAMGFLMGIVACAARDRHVRVDVFRERMRPRTRDWVDLYGLLCLQLPFLLLVLWSALPFVADSFATSERSASAGGLGYRFLLKAMLPISFGLLVLASLGKLLILWQRLFGPPSGPVASEPSSRDGSRG